MNARGMRVCWSRRRDASRRTKLCIWGERVRTADTTSPGKPGGKFGVEQTMIANVHSRHRRKDGRRLHDYLELWPGRTNGRTRGPVRNRTTIDNLNSGCAFLFSSRPEQRTFICNMRVGQKVIPRPSADYFVVGRRQKARNLVAAENFLYNLIVLVLQREGDMN
jgi:hypothetical protein